MEYVHTYSTNAPIKMMRQIVDKGASRRVALYYSIVCSAAGITAFLAGYLWILIARISHHGGAASVGLDVILGFHVLALMAVAISILSRILASNRFWLYVAICCGLIELLFLSMNMVGMVWVIRPGS